MAFIDSNQILYKSQYGFRKQMSTSLAIIELVEEITNSLDNHDATIGVLLISKRYSTQLITASSLKSFILEWTTSLDTSSRTLFVRMSTSNVELRNFVRL